MERERSVSDVREDDKSLILLAALGAIPVIWCALIIAPLAGEGGLTGILSGYGDIDPYHITVMEGSIKTVLLFIILYAFVVGVCFSMKRHYRRGEEHGSAKWGSAKSISSKYADRRYPENKLLTRNVRIGFDGKKHKRNLNVLVCGGSGSGKTRYYARPNVMQANNSSLVILDPKGEILRDTGRLLSAVGYELRILDLINMEKSHCYNPFMYLDTDNDVQRLVTNLFKATTPKDAQPQDPFWDTAASMLLLALIFYLKYEAPPDEQNFDTVMEMIRAGDVKEDNDNYQSILDELFNRLEMKNRDHIALKYYRNYHSGSAKTLKSIQITLASRLEKFNLPELAKLAMIDEMDFARIGEKRIALFAIIPDNDTSFNFLISIMYTQLFQKLFHTADTKYGGTLPVHVHFVMDEFPNVSLPEDFDKILSVMRSRGVSVSIIIQNMAQLKALFEKEWESITGNCDTFIYLGGNEQSTHEYVSKLLGRETIDTNTYNQSWGTRGNYTTNYQIAGRELLTPDEVRILDNRYALLFIRGEKPVMDEKYDLMKHPNIGLTPEKDPSLAYEHGTTPLAVAHLTAAKGTSMTVEAPKADAEYVILTESELEKSFNPQKEENVNEKSQNPLA
jgi:type IV secretion system protein VirD4